MKQLKTDQALTAYTNSLTTRGYSNESRQPFEASIKGKKYQVEIFSKRISALGKFGTGLKAFTLTLLSGGFALFSEEVRASWRAAFNGKKVRVICKEPGPHSGPAAVSFAHFRIGDKDEALKILESDPLMFSYVSKKNHNDDDLLRAVCSHLGKRPFYTADGYRMFDKKQLDNKEMMMLAVKSYPPMLKDVSRRLKGDKELVRAAVERDPDAFRFASPDLKKDRAFVLEMVRLSGKTLLYADPSMGEDEDIVRASIETYGGALKKAAERFRGNKQIVLLAFENEIIESGYETPLYSTLSKELQKDQEVYLAALRLKAAEKADASKAYQKSTAQQIIKNFSSNSMPEEAKADRELFSILIENDHKSIQYASDELKDNEDLIIQSCTLEYASERLRNDKEFVLRAIKFDCKDLTNISDALRDDEEIAIEFYRQGNIINSYLSDRLRNSVGFFRRLIKENIRFIPYRAGSEVLENRVFIEEFIRHDPFKVEDWKKIPLVWLASSIRAANKEQQINIIRCLPPELQKLPEITSSVLKSVLDAVANKELF